MSEDSQLTKKRSSIIQEIETQLEDYLRRQREEIEKSLEERIQKERELARQQLTEIEQAVRREWLALEEYGQVWEQFEDRRQEILRNIKECLQRISDRQQEIEKLTRATSEDLRSISRLHEELEELRRQSLERAEVLKKGLEEKFGLKPEIPEPAEAERMELDLTPELEKLRKIKELLLLESGLAQPRPSDYPEESEIRAAAVEEPVPPIEPAPEKPAEPESPTPMKEAPEPTLEDKLAEEIRKTIAGRQESISAVGSESSSGPAPKAESYGALSRQDLEEFYREEAANGSSSIGFYQKGKKNILEVEELLSRLREAIEEARKLNYKMAFVTAAKEQFYLKQEIISLQEGVRRYLLRVAFLATKKNFRFPALTQDILNQQVLEELSDQLAVQNWSSDDDLSRFEQKIIDLTASFKARTTPASIYYGALMRELEA
ncbi:MAG: hypothetical protein QME69_06255 [Candidatus Saccharicenans sp.]|nr:hypothetical protein [Candidatus Saccharicenans sp.]